MTEEDNDSSELELIIDHKNGKKQTIVVPSEKVFVEPELTDDPLIFWVWEKRFKPAFTIRKDNVIVMNLHGIKTMRDCEEDLIGCPQYLSSVLIEELTHIATTCMANHNNWITFLTKLHEEVW